MRRQPEIGRHVPSECLAAENLSTYLIPLDLFTYWLCGLPIGTVLLVLFCRLHRLNFVWCMVNEHFPLTVEHSMLLVGKHSLAIVGEHSLTMAREHSLVLLQEHS